MREKGRNILKTLPLVRQVSSTPGKDGKVEVIEIAPASSAEYRAAQALLAEAAKLEAARLGLPTEVQRVELTRQIEKMTNEELLVFIQEEAEALAIALVEAERRKLLPPPRTDGKYRAWQRQYRNDWPALLADCIDWRGEHPALTNWKL